MLTQSHRLSMLMGMNSLATYLQLQVVWVSKVYCGKRKFLSAETAIHLSCQFFNSQNCGV
ncbi:hypothetical protein F0230_05550 [Vibrio aestuarianus]|nr:hypothetical protein [Vibrio aestuarianus]